MKRRHQISLIPALFLGICLQGPIHGDEVPLMLRPAPPPPAQPVPNPIRDGIATITETNTVGSPEHQSFLVLHAPSDGAGPPFILLYDNRDRGHSSMDLEAFPQIARLVYPETIRQNEGDRGAQIFFLHNMPTLGNASVAFVNNPLWRGMSRLLSQNGLHAQILANQYVNNHLYIYPEHSDHRKEYGDVFHANTPYLLSSQGSSGSDQPFLQAVARTMTAFPAETYRYLTANHLLMPTMQMILRASRKPVRTPEDYLSGKAHPVVFNSASLDVDRMVAMAREMAPGQVPPLVRLRVEEEDDDTIPGVDYFEAGSAEKLFDTVSAIARVARATRLERRMVVSAGQTTDPNGHALTFHWRLLAGDPARVRIQVLDEAGTRAELRIAWHERGIRDGGELPSSRVDIGVFASNGFHNSAPAFISWYFPANEKRIYSEDGRILSVEFLPPNVPGSYVDPVLVTPADWKDSYQYAEDGRLLGWLRTRDGHVESFTRDGARVLERDEKGRPILAQAVRYQREELEKQWPKLKQSDGEERFHYAYASETDLVGVRVPPAAEENTDPGNASPPPPGKQP
jgi:hypothetical protein